MYLVNHFPQFSSLALGCQNGYEPELKISPIKKPVCSPYYLSFFNVLANFMANLFMLKEFEEKHASVSNSGIK